MTFSPTRFLTLLFALAVVASGCQSQAQVPPAPPPRRPQEIKARRTAQDTVPDDCRPTDASTLPPSLAYKERSVDEATNLANDGFDMLKRAESPKVPRLEREQLVTEAVERFIEALKADPYNVHATYNLAAAYARIGRHQCSVNLLDRLVSLQKLPSQRDAVEDKLDRLLGRGKYRNDLDPDFQEMRDMEMFREVIKKFQKS